MNLDQRDRILMLSVAAFLLGSLLAGSAVAAPPAAVADQPAAAPLPIAEPESAGMSSERLERLSEAVGAYIDRGQVAGTVTLVARRGKVVHFEAQGHRWSSSSPRRRT